MKLYLKYTTLSFLLCLHSEAKVKCHHKVVARFKSSGMKEVSGIAQSPLNKDIFFVHNDHGKGSRFYALGSNGKLAGRYKILGLKKADLEDMSTGNCLDEKGVCLFFADIGDNQLTRKSIRIVELKVPVVELKKKKKKPAWIDYQAKNIYEYKLPLAYNSEAMVYSDKEKAFFIFTKSHKATRKRSKNERGTSHIFKLDPVTKSVTSLGALALGALSTKDYKASHLFVTSADLDSSGRYLLLSTLKRVYSFELEDGLIKNLSQRFKGTYDLPSFHKDQFEAVAYQEAPRSFYAISEHTKGGGKLDLYLTRCEEVSQKNHKKKGLWHWLLALFS